MSTEGAVGTTGDRSTWRGARVGVTPERPKAEPGITTPVSLFVDANDTPVEVLESLDGVVLSHRILEQEGIIAELRGRLAELEDALIAVETGRLAGIHCTWFLLWLTIYVLSPYKTYIHGCCSRR